MKKILHHSENFGFFCPNPIQSFYNHFYVPFIYHRTQLLSTSVENSSHEITCCFAVMPTDTSHFINPLHFLSLKFVVSIIMIVNNI